MSRAPGAHILVVRRLLRAARVAGDRLVDALQLLEGQENGALFRQRHDLGEKLVVALGDSGVSRQCRVLSLQLDGAG